MLLSRPVIESWKLLANQKETFSKATVLSLIEHIEDQDEIIEQLRNNVEILERYALQQVESQ